MAAPKCRFSSWSARASSARWSTAKAVTCNDLRELKFANAGEGLWRRTPTIERNGNLYPTHGLGPIAHA